MSNDFDPYLNWLAIRDPQRPPNHYRLLGLELFEQDGNLISLAADRQMAQIRHFQSGQYAEYAERILNELAAARLCLLKPERRAQYDQSLRSMLTSAAVDPAKPMAPRHPPTAPLPDARDASPVVAGGSNSAFAVAQPAVSRVTKLPKKSSLGVWLALAGVTVVCGILIAVLINRHSGDPESSLAKQPGKSTETPEIKLKKQVAQPSITVSAKATPEKNGDQHTAKTNETPPKPNITPATQPKTTSTPPDPGKVTLETPEKTEQEPSVSPKPGDVPEANPTEVALAEKTEAPSSTESPVTEAEASTDTRLPIPAKAELEAKQKEVREIFKEEFAARDPQAKMAFAAQLLKTARETPADHALRYVLLNEAQDVAANSGNIDVVYACSKQLGEEFVVDPTGELVTATTKLQALPGRPAEYYRSLLTKILESVETLQKNDDYESALRMSNIGMGLAKKISDQTAYQQFMTLNKELLQAKTLYARVKPARDKLKMDPKDPAANGVWGLYLCFQKNNLATGLPFLARGDDAALSALAKNTLAGAKTAEAKMALADEWWELAEKEKDSLRTGMRDLAGTMYQEILPEFKGLPLSKIEKRLKELQGASGGVRVNEMALRKQLLSTRWTLNWMNPVAKEIITFLPNGTCKDHYLFVAWELQNGEVILKAAPDDKQQKIGRMKLVKGQYLAEISINGKIANTAIVMPSQNGM